MVARATIMHRAPVRGVLALLVMAAPLAVSCATPSPMVRLDPGSPDVVWVAGRASVMREEGGVRVGVAFDHQDGPNLGVRVEVENDSDHPFDLDPHALTYTPCAGTLAASCG